MANFSNSIHGLLHAVAFIFFKTICHQQEANFVTIFKQLWFSHFCWKDTLISTFLLKTLFATRNFNSIKNHKLTYIMLSCQQIKYLHKNRAIILKKLRKHCPILLHRKKYHHKYLKYFALKLTFFPSLPSKRFGKGRKDLKISFQCTDVEQEGCDVISVH